MHCVGGKRLFRAFGWSWSEMGFMRVGIGALCWPKKVGGGGVN